MPAYAADPYDIYAIVPLTGPAAFIGKAEALSLSVIEDSTNKAGGVRGRPIHFVVLDDQTSPQVGVQLMTEVAAKKVPIVLGSTLVALCSAMAPLIKDGPVEWCFSNGYHPPEGSYGFSSGASTFDLDSGVVRYARDRGWHKIAVVSSTDASGQDGDRTFDAALARPENSAMSVAAHEHFSLGDISMAAQMAHVKSSGAQVLFAWTTGTALGTILRNYQDAGMTIPVITGSGNSTYAQMKAYADELPKQMYFTGTLSLSPNQLPNGPVKRAALAFVTAFKSTGVRPDIGANQAWDGTLIVLEALKKLGLDATPAQIRDYITHLRGWSGISGRYDFAAIPQRGLGLDWCIVQRWDAATESWVGVSKPGGAPL